MTRKQNQKPIEEIECANCHTMYEDSEYARWCRLIMKHKPACSYECNKALGQVK
jgi:hypothetical protein